MTELPHRAHREGIACTPARRHGLLVDLRAVRKIPYLKVVYPYRDERRPAAVAPRRPFAQVAETVPLTLQSTVRSRPSDHAFTPLLLVVASLRTFISIISS